MLVFFRCIQSTIRILNNHIPSGASVKSLLHYGQLMGISRFRQFDYGAENNMKIYNRSTPPDYSLKNCTVPVAIIYSDHDTLVSERDVRRLPNELPNVMIIRRVDDDTFNHLDFILASDAKELVYDSIVDWMKMMEQRHNTDDMWILNVKVEFENKLIVLLYFKVQICHCFLALNKNIKFFCVRILNEIFLYRDYVECFYG